MNVPLVIFKVALLLTWNNACSLSSTPVRSFWMVPLPVTVKVPELTLIVLPSVLIVFPDKSKVTSEEKLTLRNKVIVASSVALLIASCRVLYGVSPTLATALPPSLLELLPVLPSSAKANGAIVSIMHTHKTTDKNFLLISFYLLRFHENFLLHLCKKCWKEEVLQGKIAVLCA